VDISLSSKSICVHASVQETAGLSVVPAAKTCTSVQ
jgi:hypothetical protein